MRNYMTQSHRDLIDYFSKKQNLLLFLDKQKNNTDGYTLEIIELIEERYNECIKKCIHFVNVTLKLLKNM